MFNNWLFGTFCNACFHFVSLLLTRGCGVNQLLQLKFNKNYQLYPLRCVWWSFFFSFVSHSARGRSVESKKNTEKSTHHPWTISPNVNCNWIMCIHDYSITNFADCWNMQNMQKGSKKLSDGKRNCMWLEIIICVLLLCRWTSSTRTIKSHLIRFLEDKTNRIRKKTHIQNAAVFLNWYFFLEFLSLSINVLSIPNE